MKESSQSREEPKDSREEPKDSREEPKDSREEPKDSREEPRESPKVPLQSKEAPVRSRVRRIYPIPALPWALSERRARASRLLSRVVPPAVLPRILHESAAVVIINKRPGEDAEKLFHTADSPNPRLRAVNRLDVPVSGCMLFARNAAVQTILTTAFAQGQVLKRYWAIVERPAEPAASLLRSHNPDSVVTHWLKTDTARNKAVAYDTPVPHGKKSLLRWRCAGESERYWFLEIDLLTGRHHQIRAQLARLGLPIKGDLKYGARRSEPGGGIRLHSASITIPAAVLDESLHVSAPPPVADRLWDACAAAVSARGPVWTALSAEAVE